MITVITTSKLMQHRLHKNILPDCYNRGRPIFNGHSRICVNEARKDLFCRKSQSMDRIPPTQNALLQHTQRAIYQAGLWTTNITLKYSKHFHPHKIFLGLRVCPHSHGSQFGWQFLKHQEHVENWSNVLVKETVPAASVEKLI